MASFSAPLQSKNCLRNRELSRICAGGKFDKPMTANANQLTEVIHSVFREIAKTLGGDTPQLSDSFVLLGADSALDSLAMLNFFVLLEEKIDNSFGQHISFLEKELLGAPEGKLDTIGNLREFLINELNAEKAC